MYGAPYLAPSGNSAPAEGPTIHTADIGRLCAGKSSLLHAMANREIPIQDMIDVFLLAREMPASEKSALQCVMDVDEERVKLEALAEELAHCTDEESQEELMDVYERLDEIGADTAEARAGNILHGLGFSKVRARVVLVAVLADCAALGPIRVLCVFYV